VEDGVKVLGVPAERRGQRLQGPATPASLDDVVLKFPDGRLRDARTLREFALTPSEFIHSLVDGLGDCRPILRHLLLRAPPGAEISRSFHSMT